MSLPSLINALTAWRRAKYYQSRLQAPVATLNGTKSPIQRDLADALIGLGAKKGEAREMARQTCQDHPRASLDDLLRESMRRWQQK